MLVSLFKELNCSWTCDLSFVLSCASFLIKLAVMLDLPFLSSLTTFLLFYTVLDGKMGLKEKLISKEWGEETFHEALPSHLSFLSKPHSSLFFPKGKKFIRVLHN